MERVCAQKESIMTFFCRKAATADGRVRWAVCVPTFLGFITIGWFYSAELAAAFVERLESDETTRRLAEEDAWRGISVQDRSVLERQAAKGSRGSSAASQEPARPASGL